MARNAKLQAECELIKRLLQEYEVTSREDLAEVSGLSIERIRYLLGYIRSHQDDLGWSIPHCGRGRRSWDGNGECTNDHLFQVVEHNKPGHYNVAAIRAGLIGTLAQKMVECDNEAYAMEHSYPGIGATDPKMAQWLTDFSDDLLKLGTKCERMINRLERGMSYPTAKAALPKGK